MGSFALLLHPRRPAAVEVARDVHRWLQDRGHEVRLLEPDARVAGLDAHAVDQPDLVAGLDLAVSLGGDGTMLRAVDLVGDAGVPVLGVNLGQLGYLAEVEPANLIDALERFLAGRHLTEERMRMAVVSDGRAWPALNEAVVGKTPTGQMAEIEVAIDGVHFTTYYADGVIVATPTGSTAYAWSAGGPLMAPDHSALVLVPVAPHMLFDRALVLSPDACVSLTVDARAADLSIDGRSVGELEPGQGITCTRAEQPARLVTFGERNFLGILKAKFGLGER